MNKKEVNLLKHLTRATEFADTYFCGIAKNNKNKFMYTVEDSIKTWVEQNGGTFRKLSDKKFMGDKKGFLVKIVFPSFNNAKQIMVTI
jgi:hypothetical protein